MERSQNSSLLGKMGELLQSCTSTKEAFSIVLGYAPKMFPNLKGAVILLNASRSLLEVVGEWGGCQLPSGVFEPDSCLGAAYRACLPDGRRSRRCSLRTCQ